VRKETCSLRHSVHFCRSVIHAHMVLRYVRVYWGFSDVGEYTEDNGLCEICQFDISWIMWKNNTFHLMCIYDIGEYTEYNGLCECCQFDVVNLISIGYCGRVMHTTLYIRNITTRNR